jgi:class 3 adenylate cyclase
MLIARAGCVLWTVAGFGMLVHLMLGATVPATAELVVAFGCTLLVLAMDRFRYEFQHRGARLIAAPEAGFVLLLVVAVDPMLSVLAAAVVGAGGSRHLATWTERAFHVGTWVLATGVPALVVHDAFGDEVRGRVVLVAVALAAVSRAFLVLLSQLLLAQTRSKAGALIVLRDMPIVTIFALEAGLPTATVAMAGPFLDEPPLALLVVLAGQLLTWRLLALQHDQFTGRRIADQMLDTFQRYVPRHVADALVRRRGDAAFGIGPDVGGERRDLTVLFLDVRGFTSWSERTDPAEVFDQLNLLLGELADAVLSTDGTIDKFTGDGLMAFWNAPLDQPDHAERALRCVPKLLMRVREVNLRRDARQEPPFEVGIGIATGPAMVGNVGHRDRLAFTAIGDTVNLAARLEAATREVDVPVLLDERAFLALPQALQRQLMRLESIEVKGRRERARLYSPTALVHRRDAA